MKKAAACLFLFLLFFFPTQSAFSAAAEERVDVRYYFNGELLLSVRTPVGTEVAPLLYETVKELGGDPTPGTVYEWRKGSPDGEKANVFAAQTDIDLYLVPAETDVKRYVTYRYDYFDENHFLSQTVEYLYGADYFFPESVNGQPVSPCLYKSPEYGLKANNELKKPAYVLEDMIVYVTTKADALYSVDGVTRRSAYGQKPDAGVKKDHKLVGFFTDPEFVTAYTGPAINGLNLYALWQRVSYTVTVETAHKTTELSLSADEPILKEKSLPDGYVWKIGSEKVTFPYIVDEDVTLSGADPKQVAMQEREQNEQKVKTLTKDEIVAVAVIGAAFIAVGAYVLIRYFLKKTKNNKKRKRKITSPVSRIEE